MASDDNLLRILVVILGVIVLLPLLMMAFTMPMMGMWGWGHMGDGGMWGNGGGTWPWLLTWLVTLAVVGTLGYLVYRAVRRSAGTADPAIEELRAAYARGELSDEEYENRLERLERE